MFLLKHKSSLIVTYRQLSPANKTITILSLNNTLKQMTSTFDSNFFSEKHSKMRFS